VPAYCVKDGSHEDAEEFLGLYLNALDEELVELHTYISTHRPASTPRIEAQSAEGQAEAEVGIRDHTVRPSHSLTALSSSMLTYAWTRIGRYSRVAHLAHIQRKIPFDHSHAKPARHHHYRSLAITRTLHSGPFPLSSAHIHVLVNNIRALGPARVGAYYSRRTRTHQQNVTTT
jgi:hypothetical protein